jgi:VIT1/CCC1 family predicted Fe2+/Mn2+ transporter
MCCIDIQEMQVSTIAFDTLKFAQTLRDKAKLSPEQAEGISQAFSDATGEQLATRSDIVMLDSKVERVETRLLGDINLLKWMVGFTLAAVMAILFMLIKK